MVGSSNQAGEIAMAKPPVVIDLGSGSCKAGEARGFAGEAPQLVVPSRVGRAKYGQGAMIGVAWQLWMDGNWRGFGILWRFHQGMSPDFTRMLREKLEAYVTAGWRSQPSKMGKLGMVYVLLY